MTFFNVEVDGVRKEEADVSLHLQDAVLALTLAVDMMTGSKATLYSPFASTGGRRTVL